MIFHYPLIKVIEMTYSARGYKKNLVADHHPTPLHLGTKDILCWSR